MIYLFEMGEYEDRQVKAVFEGPAGLRVDLAAFLESLGLRPQPEWPQDVRIENDPARAHDVLMTWTAYLNAWQDERVALLKANGIYKQEDPAHLAWLREQPALRELNYETEFEFI